MSKFRRETMRVRSAFAAAANAVDEPGREQPADLSLGKTCREYNAPFARTEMVAG